MRSASRTKSLSMPRRKPRIWLTGTIGTSSTRSPYWTTCSFWPGRRPSDSRMRLGITTWYFGDTVTESITDHLSIGIAYNEYRIDVAIGVQPADGAVSGSERYPGGTW